MLTDEQHNALYDVLRDYKVHAGNGSYYTQRIAILEELLASSAAMPIVPVAQQAVSLTDGAPPSFDFNHRLTPFGMLVRALRIVAGTTLYDMAKALLTTPAKLSAMEFGRAPVTSEFAFDVSAYFDALGISNTKPALDAALQSHSEGDQQ